MVTRRKPLVIAGERIRLGETRELQLQFAESYLGRPVTVPVHVLRGPKSGPRVFMTAAIHGDEVNGLGIIRELIYNRQPRLVQGTLILIPVVNIYGLERHSRYMPDRRDPNRCFPGSTTGSLTSRLAHAVFDQVVRQCDYGLDFHSAPVRRTNYPNVRADMRNNRTRMLAKVFGSELIVNSKGPVGSLRRCAVEAGIPTIILEAGEVWKIEPRVVEIGVKGCINVLKALGMIRGAPKTPSLQVSVSKTMWVRANKGGILAFHARPGDLVRQSQPLATNFSVFAREQTALLAPADGLVLGMSTMPAVKPGEAVYHIAALSKRSFNEVAQKLRRRSQGHLFTRIREDLATNITILDRQDNGTNKESTF